MTTKQRGIIIPETDKGNPAIIIPETDKAGPGIIIPETDKSVRGVISPDKRGRTIPDIDRVAEKVKPTD